MPFKSGKRPTLKIPETRLHDFLVKLLSAGYIEHDGRKTKVPGEVLTFRKRFMDRHKKSRQNHVQIIYTSPDKIEVFAHTEPYMGSSVRDLIKHGISAIFDDASFQAGSRMLRKDLAAIERSM
jgi:hypothetical protein